MPLSVPALICGTTTMLASEVADTSLFMTPCTEAPPLLYGILLNLMTVASEIISATKYGVLPLTAVAQVALPFCAFAQATNSFMLLAGTLGLTMMVDGATAIMPTGTRSESLYGRSLSRRLLVIVLATPLW